VYFMTPILLALILAVLLFGGAAVLSGLGWLAAIVVAMIVVVVICRWIGDGLEALGVEFEAQKQNGTHLSSVLYFIAAVGNFAVFGIAYLLKEPREPMGHALEQLPLWWMPITLFALSFPLGWLEKSLRRRAAAKKACTPR
jgi:hypothetical protein